MPYKKGVCYQYMEIKVTTGKDPFPNIRFATVWHILKLPGILRQQMLGEKTDLSNATLTSCWQAGDGRWPPNGDKIRGAVTCSACFGR